MDKSYKFMCILKDMCVYAKNIIAFQLYVEGKADSTLLLRSMIGTFRIFYHLDYKIPPDKVLKDSITSQDSASIKQYFKSTWDTYKDDITSIVACCYKDNGKMSRTTIDECKRFLKVLAYYGGDFSDKCIKDFDILIEEGEGMEIEVKLALENGVAPGIKGFLISEGILYAIRETEEFCVVLPWNAETMIKITTIKSKRPVSLLGYTYKGNKTWNTMGVVHKTMLPYALKGKLNVNYIKGMIEIEQIRAFLHLKYGTLEKMKETHALLSKQAGTNSRRCSPADRPFGNIAAKEELDRAKRKLDAKSLAELECVLNAEEFVKFYGF